MFNDRAKGKVLGKGNNLKLYLPKLQDVRLVKGLSANLISISQLFDQGFLVSFAKDKFEVLDKEKNTITIGTCLFDNCYHWNPCTEYSVYNLTKSMKLSCDTNILDT